MHPCTIAGDRNSENSFRNTEPYAFFFELYIYARLRESDHVVHNDIFDQHKSIVTKFNDAFVVADCDLLF